MELELEGDLVLGVEMELGLALETVINKIASPRDRTHAFGNRNKFVFLAKKRKN